MIFPAQQSKSSLMWRAIVKRVDGSRVIISLLCCPSRVTLRKINKRHLGNWEPIQLYPATKKHYRHKIKNKWAERLNATWESQFRFNPLTARVTFNRDGHAVFLGMILLIVPAHQQRCCSREMWHVTAESLTLAAPLLGYICSQLSANRQDIGPVSLSDSCWPRSPWECAGLAPRTGPPPRLDTSGPGSSGPLWRPPWSTCSPAPSPTGAAGPQTCSPRGYIPPRWRRLKVIKIIFRR